MTTYGPWVQPDDHTFDYRAAYHAGHVMDPEAVDPEFARLPPSISWGNFVDPDEDGTGYYNGSIEDERLFSDFRPRGGVRIAASTDGFGQLVPFTDVNPTWDNGDYTTPTAAHADFIAAWQDRWNHAKIWDTDGDPAVYGSIRVYPESPYEYSPSFDGPLIDLEMDRAGQYNDFPWLGAYAAVNHQVGITYYVPDEEHLLQYRPDPGPLPAGAQGVEWEGPATVVGASIYIKTGRMMNGVTGAAYGSSQPGLNGLAIGPSEGALVFASWHARNYHNTGSGWEYGILPELHGEFYPCRIILRQGPALAKIPRYGKTFGLAPTFAPPSSYADLPIIYDGPPIAGTDDPLLIDVTQFLNPDDGNSLTILAHLSDFQLDGELPTLHPTGYDIGKADYAGFRAVMGDGYFSSYGGYNNHNWSSSEYPEAQLPYMVWTIRPPRYRFVYSGTYEWPGLSGDTGDVRADFSPAGS